MKKRVFVSESFTNGKMNHTLNYLLNQRLKHVKAALKFSKGRGT